jgi:hypothetical protein
MMNRAIASENICTFALCDVLLLKSKWAVVVAKRFFIE